MELAGKEYRRRLVPVMVKVKQWKKCWIEYKPGGKTEKIWSKRRCFVCNGKFKHGDNITLTITDQGNKMICPECTGIIEWI